MAEILLEIKAYISDTWNFFFVYVKLEVWPDSMYFINAEWSSTSQESCLFWNITHDFSKSQVQNFICYRLTKFPVTYLYCYVLQVTAANELRK